MNPLWLSLLQYVSLEGLVEFNTFCLIARRQWRPLRTLFRCAGEGE